MRYKAKARTSVVWRKTKEELQNLLDKSNSIKSVLEALGLQPLNGNHRTLNERIKIDGLSLDKLRYNRKISQEKHLISLRSRYTFANEDVFIQNGNYSTKNLKSRIVRDNIIPYFCEICKNDGNHNGLKLVLQIDHKNGINNDNRLENLRFLCPNCHSQTKTYAGKRLKREKNYETEEEKVKRILVQRKFNPTKEELMLDLENGNFSSIGRKYGVSDNAVRKRCKLMNLI